MRTQKPLLELNPIHMVGRGIKNIIGVVFLLSGFIMLFIPGQGILTILLGISLIDFPGKNRLLLRLLRSPRVNQLIHWCRQKTGRGPLLIPESESHNSQ